MKLTTHYDVVIIGGGIMGAAVFYYAAKTGKKVVLLERNQFCSGSTGSSGGFIRALHKSLLFSELACESYFDFLEIGQKLNRPIEFRKSTFFMIDKTSHYKNYDKQIQLITDYGIDIKTYTNSDIENADKFNLHLNDDEMLICEKNAGYVDPINTTKAFILAGQSLGGVAIQNVAVNEILMMGGKAVGVNTEYSKFYASNVVVTAGAQSKDLLQGMSIAIPGLVNKLIQIDYFSNPDSFRLPTFLDNNLGLYGRAIDKSLAFIGLSRELQEFDSNIAQLNPSYTNKLMNIASQRIPDFDKWKWSGGCCAIEPYTNDGDGLLKEITEIPGLFILSAWGGAGFKIAPACAKRIVSMLNKR